MNIKGRINRKFFISVFASFLILATTNTTTPKFNATTIPKSYSVRAQKVDSSNQKIKYLTKQQVLEDIDYVLNKIETSHIGCINGIPFDVLKQKELEINKLSESTSIIEEWRMICRILTKFNDAHTSIIGPRFLYDKRLPFYIEYSDDKLFCTNNPNEYLEITEINDVKISDMYKNFKSHFSYEIEEWPHVNFFRVNPFFLQSTLARAGIDTLKPVKVKFKTPNGTSTQYFNFINVENKFKTKQPFVSYRIDKENSVAIFTLNSCIFNKSYCDIVDSFFADVSLNNIKNIIVDLRTNTGGNNQVEMYFARYLQNLKNMSLGKYETRIGDNIKSENITLTSDILKVYKFDKNLFNGKIFILTSNFTFSSAMLFARDFSDNNLATIIGEVPGNSPTSFADIAYHEYYTPHSNLKFSTTFRKIHRADKTKSSNKLIPDIQVPSINAMNEAYKLIC